MSEGSPCIRCGKLRIVAKTWQEEVNGAKVTVTQTVCPDAECQKIVESELKKKMEKIANIQKESQERRSRIRRGRKQANK